jgi:hypothetical protein
MGQSVAVTEKPTGHPGMLRFEVNRPLTGMGHERYRSLDDCTGDRPPDVLARRLLEHGGIKAVHVYGNQVTVELEAFGSSEGLIDIVRGLFIHYLDGVEPKKFG